MKLKKDLMDRIGISTSWRTLDAALVMRKHICIAWSQGSGRSSIGSVYAREPSPLTSHWSAWTPREWSVSCTHTIRNRGFLSLRTMQGCWYFEALLHENPCAVPNLSHSLLVETNLEIRACKSDKGRPSAGGSHMSRVWERKKNEASLPPAYL